MRLGPKEAEVEKELEGENDKEKKTEKVEHGDAVSDESNRGGAGR